mmetsp:Transcript_24280/g.83897  ORF Transcript_24280/g.83897 Transcript_24280/m.83897 type:complete len:244 (+) Transcript_24280:187-918(+)
MVITARWRARTPPGRTLRPNARGRTRPRLLERREPLTAARGARRTARTPEPRLVPSKHDSSVPASLEPMGCRARRSRSSGVLVSAAVVRFGSGRGRLREQPWASGHCSASRPESAARVDVHRGPANGVQRRREASRRGRRAMLNRSMCTLCTRAARCAGRVQRAACAAAALSRSRARTAWRARRAAPTIARDLDGVVGRANVALARNGVSPGGNGARQSGQALQFAARQDSRHSRWYTCEQPS